MGSLPTHVSPASLTAGNSGDQALSHRVGVHAGTTSVSYVYPSLCLTHYFAIQQDISESVLPMETGRGAGWVGGWVGGGEGGSAADLGAETGIDPGSL